MNFVCNYWSLIILAIVVVVIIVEAIIKFSKMPSDKQEAKIKECLLSWVVAAEKDLGSGTGKIKLSTVYSLFCTTFPIIKNFVSLEKFNDYVDEALEEMRKLLGSNKSLNQLVTTGTPVAPVITDKSEETAQIETKDEAINEDK